MKKEEFIVMIGKLKPSSFTKPFNIIISDKATESGKAEVYKVAIYATKTIKKYGHPLYKLNWEDDNGKRRLPILKYNIKRTLIAATSNTTTFLTSGFAVYVTNDEGMRSSEDLWRLLNLFAQNGLAADILLF